MLAQRDGKLEPAPLPWMSDSNSQRAENSSDDHASQYSKGAALFFLDRSTSFTSASKASTRSASSDTWATGMAEAASQGTISALNHNGESFGQDNTDMAILKKVSMLEAQKEALHMQIVILREDSKAQEAKNQAELAQVQASAKSEIEHVKANAAAESEKDSRVLMKIVKKLRVDIVKERAKNKVKIEHVKANAAVESKKFSSLLMRIVTKHKEDSTAQKAKNKAELAQVKAQASVDI